MASISDGGVTRLERTARLAGECFGHEEIAPLPQAGGNQRMARLLWWGAAFGALAGFTILALR